MNKILDKAMAADLARLGQANFIRSRRPFLVDGKSFVTQETGRVPCPDKCDNGIRFAADKRLLGSVIPDRCPTCEGRGTVTVLENRPSALPAFLTRAQWVEVDRAAIRGYLACTPITTCLRKMSSFNGFEGMCSMTLEQERLVDTGEEVVSIDGEPKYQIVALPLPITYCDSFGTNFIGILDMTEAAARRCGEVVEKTVLLGISSKDTQLYGLCTFPARLRMSFEKDKDLVAVVGVMIDRLKESKFYGPYVLVSEAGEPTEEGCKISQEILGLEGIAEIVEGCLPENELLLVQAAPDTIRVVCGLELSIAQWGVKEEKRGDKFVQVPHFKALTITVPQLFADLYGRAGVCHAKVG